MKKPLASTFGRRTYPEPSFTSQRRWITIEATVIELGGRGAEMVTGPQTRFDSSWRARVKDISGFVLAGADMGSVVRCPGHCGARADGEQRRDEVPGSAGDDGARDRKGRGVVLIGGDNGRLGR